GEACLAQEPSVRDGVERHAPCEAERARAGAPLRLTDEPEKRLFGHGLKRGGDVRVPSVLRIHLDVPWSPYRTAWTEQPLEPRGKPHVGRRVVGEVRQAELEAPVVVERDQRAEGVSV